nr:TVP38/TMEM64 family protein [Clostridium formicaceticum]
MIHGLIIIIVLIAIYFLNRIFLFKDYTPQQIKEYVYSFEVLAPIIYIILFTFVPLTLFPDSILAIAGGMCFGLLKGSIYTMIGALCGGTLSFCISRFLGKCFMKKLANKDLGDLSKSIEVKGFWIVLLLRLIPLFPYDVISYSAGLSNVKYKDFLWATFFGIIPGVLVFTNIGDKATNIASEEFYFSIGLLVFLLIASVILKKKFPLKKIEKTI